MRVFLYSAIGIPLLIADAVLLWALPARMASRLTTTQGLILLFGALAYLGLHFLLRKPERMYLWAHEFTHLFVAKLFLRNVHGFHITSRSGGKVVIDRTNVAIDLAPYAVPVYNVVALLPVTLVAGGTSHARMIYLGGGGVPVRDAPLLFRGGVHRRATGRPAQRQDLLPGRRSAPADAVDADPGGAGDPGRIFRPARFLPGMARQRDGGGSRPAGARPLPSFAPFPVDCSSW